jgi:Asp-tRNA(Asn)/Glu-tRNA(Gln) amidotransferase A subunit family amidase
VSDLVHLTATDALRQFRSRELSPVELLTAVIARAQEVEPTVNAFCHTFYEQAMAQARAAEARYAGRGEPPRALEGIPLVIKEDESVAGQPWTQASLIDCDLVADRTSTFAQRMLDAGAVVHARTTMAEFGTAAFTQSRLWGITRNPRNPDYSPGGSSGGSAAALAACSATLASGNDIAGSIRIPASFCGVVGFKPPYGRVPVDPPFNLDTYMHNGPMARTVADAALLQNVIAGPDEHDIASLRPGLVLPVEPGDARGLRVALSLDLGGWPVDREIRANTQAAAERLRAAGAVVEEVELALPPERVKRAAAIHYGPGIAYLQGMIAEHPDDVSPFLAAGLSRMRDAGADGSPVEGYAIESDLYAAFAAAIDGYDALICPAVGMNGLAAEADFSDGTTYEIDGVSYEDPFDALLTTTFNVLSRCPVLAVPSGTASNGVPTGLQIVGRTYDDATVFRVGAALERATAAER